MTECLVILQLHSQSIVKFHKGKHLALFEFMYIYSLVALWNFSHTHKSH